MISLFVIASIGNVLLLLPLLYLLLVLLLVPLLHGLHWLPMQQNPLLFLCLQK